MLTIKIARRANALAITRESIRLSFLKSVSKIIAENHQRSEEKEQKLKETTCLEPEKGYLKIFLKTSVSLDK
jgi:hypothetical protein